MRRCRPRDDRGAAAVEFALVVVPLMLVVMGIINYGVIFGQQLALNNGVRQGARAAVVAGNTTEQTCAAVVAGVRDATGPAIAMTVSNIHVTVRTQSADGATIRTTQCGSAADPTSTTRVCEGSVQKDGSVDSIRVDTSYDTDALAGWPIPGMKSKLTLTSRAVYRCEFSS